MLLGRVVASLAHGAFFGIGSVVAADLVALHRKAGAIATMFSSLAVANVVGVPLGTLIGQSVGWRITFAGVALLGVVELLGIARLVPEMPKPEGVRLRHELAAFKNVQVLLAMPMTVLGFGGVFAAVTYIAPVMTHVAGFDGSSVISLGAREEPRRHRCRGSGSGRAAAGRPPLTAAGETPSTADCRG